MMQRQHDCEALLVRLANMVDAKPMQTLLAPIIAAGGTTAIEHCLSEADVREWFIDGEDCLVCHVVEIADGTIAGFQSLGRNRRLPTDWGDIATLATIAPRPSGVGQLLFRATLDWARRAGLRCINATIRADNVKGLSYYQRLGFQTYDIAKGIALQNGPPDAITVHQPQ